VARSELVGSVLAAVKDYEQGRLIGQIVIYACMVAVAGYAVYYLLKYLFRGRGSAERRNEEAEEDIE